MNKCYDVITIGAGNGGLAGSAFAAKNGLKTLLVEKHNIPGGSATSFVRGRFEFEPSLHELASVGTADNPGGIRQLFEMLGADVEWCTDMEGTFRLVVQEEGIDAMMPCGVENFAKKMEELVPGSGESTLQVFALAKEVVAVRSYIMEPDFDHKICEEKYPNFYRMAGHTIQEGLDALGMPEKAQHILASYWCYLGAPADEMDFFTYATMLLAYVVYGAGIPKYRSHELSLALEKVVRENGGDVWYNTEINKILVKNGKAYGVVIDGEEYYADYIISNAYPELVYGKMIDSTEVPTRARKLVNSREFGLSFVTVYLGLNISVEQLGLPAYSNFIASTLDSVEQKRLATNMHDYSGYAILNCLNKAIPDCTPEGTCQLFFTTFYFGNGWDDVKPEEYDRLKTKIATDMIQDCEKKLNISIMPYIEEIEIAGPPTFARYLNTPQGTPYGYQMNKWDSYIQRTESRNKEVFIDNLYFVGASTHRGDGYSTGYLSGIDAGKEIVRAEKEKGGVAR